MRIKNLLLGCLFVMMIYACKSKNKMQTPPIEEETTSTAATPSFYWEAIEVTVESDQFESSADYTTYKLDEATFKASLKNKLVEIPDLKGNFNVFEVKPSGTMNQELADKFPDIRSYSGVQQDNKLCQCRISSNKNKIDIAVLCNDVTYYIKHFSNNDENIYVLYDKMSLKNTREIHD